MRRAVVVLVLCSCAPRLAVDRWLPSPVDVGAPTSVAVEVAAGPGDKSGVSLLVDLAGLVTGEVGSRPQVPLAELKGQLPAALTQSGHLALADAATAELTLRVTVTDFGMKAWDGNATMNNQREVRARLSATVAVSRRHDGLSTLPDRTYLAEESQVIAPDARLEDHLEGMVAQTVTGLVRQIVYDFVPVERSLSVAIDDSAPEVKAAVELLKRDDRAGARAELTRVLAATPGCAPAHYDLGLLDEGDSQFPAAEAHYRRAIELNSRRLYLDALNRVEGLRASYAPRVPAR